MRLPGRLVRDLVVALIAFGLLFWGVTRFVATPWQVLGPSMEPTLLAGDRVVILLHGDRRAPVPGEIWLVVGPDGRPLVKRVLAVDASGTFRVEGDNPDASFDSRRFGPLSRERFVGRAVWRYWPPGRAGSLPTWCEACGSSSERHKNVL